MPCSSTCCPGHPPYVLFPLTAGLPLMGSRSYCANSPFGLRETPPHLMPVEQGLPWHPVATGVASQAIPFIVAASHAHALPPAPFWFPVPVVLVTSPALLCPSSLSAVLALVPPGVAPVFCVSVLVLPLLVGAPGCPCRACPTGLPPRTRISHLRMTWTVPCAVGWSRPCCQPCGGHLPARGAQLPPLCSTWAPCRGRGGGVADGSLGMRRIWWLLHCSHLMVPLCIVVCPVGARTTAVCGAALCQLLCCLRSSQFRAPSFSAGTLTAAGVRRRGGQHVTSCIPLWLSDCPTCSWVVPGAPGTFAHVSKSTI